MTNPIIQREFIGLLRTRKALAVQLVFPLLLSALIILRWPTDARVALSGEQAQQVLRLFGFGLLVGLILLAPVFPATSIVRERRQGTLALLLNSPLSPLDILLGKIVGVVSFIFLLIALTTPAAAACYVMGGIDLIHQLLPLYAVFFLLSLEFAAIGLYISTRANSTDASLRLTYAAVFSLTLLPLGPYQFLHGIVSGPAAAIVYYSRALSPLPAVMELLGLTSLGNEGFLTHASITPAYLVSAFIISVIFLAMTLRRLGQRLLDKPRSTGTVTDEQSSGVQTYRRIMYLWFFDPNRRSTNIGPLTNPVTVKEFRTSRFGRSYWMARLIFGCLIVSLGLMLAATRSSTSWGPETLGAIMVLLQMALILFLTPSLAAGIISTERESRGWTLLQMTLLSPLKIIRGKLYSVFLMLTILLVATLPAYAVMLLINRDMAPQAVDVIITLLLTALFATLASATISSLVERTATATAISYVLLMLLCGLPLLFWLLRDSPFSFATVQAVLCVDPVAAALSVMKAKGFGEYAIKQNNWYFLGSGSVLALLVLSAQTYRLTRPR